MSEPIKHVDMKPNLGQKDAALRVRLAALDTALVAYSGGIDSAFLAWAAHRYREVLESSEIGSRNAHS